MSSLRTGVLKAAKTSKIHTPSKPATVKGSRTTSYRTSTAILTWVKKPSTYNNFLTSMNMRSFSPAPSWNSRTGINQITPMPVTGTPPTPTKAITSMNASQTTQQSGHKTSPESAFAQGKRSTSDEKSATAALTHSTQKPLITTKLSLTVKKKSSPNNSYQPSGASFLSSATRRSVDKHAMWAVKFLFYLCHLIIIL